MRDFWLPSPRMKNYRLYILISGLVLLLLQPGNAFSAKSLHDASLSKGNQIAASSIQLPHTELELHGNQWTNAAGSSYRIQGGLAFISHSEFRLTRACGMLVVTTAGSDNLSFKDYLSHLYPTHNFW